jgi:cytochrome c peroxidase
MTREWTGRPWLLALALAATPSCDRHAPLPAYKGTPKVGAHGNAGDAKAAFDASAAAAKPPSISPAALLERARPLLGVLPTEAASPSNPITDAKVELGRMLFHDARLSKSGTSSCNSCHDLARYGVDPRAQARAERDAPTVFNAALQSSQYWDGRARDIEEQVGMALLGPREMAMADEASVVAAIASVPGYAEPFAAAFPGEAKPISFANVKLAIGAFERRLLTPSPLDRFLAGDLAALDDAQLVGLQTFVDVGCTQCHTGALLGGTQFQKLGSVKPWPELKDEGRAAHTRSPLDRFVFKVPPLRNVAKTGPYLHDGGIADLATVVEKMGEHQSARGKPTSAQTRAIVAFLEALTGEPPAVLTAAPALPPSG